MSCHAEKNLGALRDWLLAAGPEAHLAFVGDGPARPDLERHFAGTQTTFMVNNPIYMLACLGRVLLQIDRQHSLFC